MITLTHGAKISKISFDLYQESDSCQDQDDGQELKVSTDDAGGGNFLILKTERWAIDADDIDNFAQSLKDILKTSENL